MTQKNQHRTATVAIATVAVLLLAGCTSAGPADLAMGGDEGTLCVPSAINDEMVLGETVHAEADITITSVGLVDSDGLRTVGDASVIALSDGATAIGAQPLSSLEQEAGTRWSGRIPATSAQLEAGSSYSVVVVVKREGETGKAARMRVAYETAEGQVDTAEGTTAFELAQSCD